jgi:hypothetical protein
MENSSVLLYELWYELSSLGYFNFSDILCQHCQFLYINISISFPFLQVSCAGRCTIVFTALPLVPV